jgi:hypothetical protein
MLRTKRSAAAMAEAKIREVLDWEELSEHSAKFKEYAARIDAEFAAEQKSKRVKERDLDIVEDEGDDNEGDCDEVPTADDLAFIEADDAYHSTDEDFHTACSDAEHSSDQESMSEHTEHSGDESGDESEHDKEDALHDHHNTGTEQDGEKHTAPDPACATTDKSDI